MIFIEAVNDIPIGMHTNTKRYHETASKAREILDHIMSDWQVRQEEVHQQLIDAWASKRPTCDYCGEPITAMRALYINGEWICEDCVNDHMEFVEDYVDDEFTANEYNPEDEINEMFT